jgi:hypothetical protein
VENFLIVQCMGATAHAAIEQTRTNAGVMCSIHRQAAQQHGHVAMRVPNNSFEKTRGNIRASQTDCEPAVCNAGAASPAMRHPFKKQGRK